MEAEDPSGYLLNAATEWRSYYSDRMRDKDNIHLPKSSFGHNSVSEFICVSIALRVLCVQIICKHMTTVTVSEMKWGASENIRPSTKAGLKFRDQLHVLKMK